MERLSTGEARAGDVAPPVKPAGEEPAAQQRNRRSAEGVVEQPRTSTSAEATAAAKQPSRSRRADPAPGTIPPPAADEQGTSRRNDHGAPEEATRAHPDAFVESVRQALVPIHAAMRARPQGAFDAHLVFLTSLFLPLFCYAYLLLPSLLIVHKNHCD